MVEAACKSGTPAEADYSACANGAALGCIADGQDCSGLTLYIRVKLTTTDSTLTPTISGIKVTVTDKKYLSFVSEPRNGVFKVYCDISNQPKGVCVSNKKTTRLHFWNGETVPAFSVWFSVAGQAAYIDAGYLFDKCDFTTFNTATSENENVVLSDAFSIDEISERTTFSPTILSATTADNAAVTLT